MTAHSPILTAPAPWHDTPEALAILTGITPAHVTLVPRTPIVGPRYTEWSAGELDGQLEEVRRRHIAEQFGKSFLECADDAEREDYLLADMRAPTVAEALRKLFGSPERWGRPSDRLIDCDRGVAVNAARKAVA